MLNLKEMSSCKSYAQIAGTLLRYKSLHSYGHGRVLDTDTDTPPPPC